MAVVCTISQCLQQIATALSNRKEDLTKKSALSKMVEDKDEFLEFLKSQRHGVFMVCVK